MSKFTMGCGVLLAIVLVIVVIAARALGGSSNAVRQWKQTVDQSWAQVQNVYQGRADLIPNLVNTVSRAQNCGKSRLTEEQTRGPALAGCNLTRTRHLLMQ